MAETKELQENKNLGIKDYKNLGINETLIDSGSPIVVEETFISKSLIKSKFGGITFDKILPSTEQDEITMTTEKDRQYLDFRNGSFIRLGRVFFNRYSLVSFFEGVDDATADVTTKGWSIDFTIAGGTPAVTAGIGGILLDTHTTSGNKIDLEAISEVDADFDNSPALETVMKLSATTSQTIYISIGDSQAGTPKFVGFKVSSSILQAAFTDSGGTERTDNLTATLTNFNRLRVIMKSEGGNAGGRIDWYVNDTIASTVVDDGTDLNFNGTTISSVGLPTGTAAGQYPVHFHIENSAAESKQMSLQYVVFSQDD